MSGRSPIGTDHKTTIIKYWMEKARESIEATKGEFTSGRNSIAVRNIYYACFYALSAVLLKEGRSFKKHTAVKAALHKDLIRTGIVDTEGASFTIGFSTAGMKGITSRFALLRPKRQKSSLTKV